MAYANGRIPPTSLRSFHGTPLLTPAFNALKALALLGELTGVTVRPASGLGSGYRDLACQKLFFDASHGNRAAIAAVGLSSSSTVQVAAPGGSSHGTGDRVDLVFNGSDNPGELHLALANHCGFTREFGAADRNHFRHDGRTAIGGPNTPDWHRIIAHYLNRQQLGQTTTTEKDGIVDRTRFQHYTWLIQAAGIRDRIYLSPPLKHDGIPGTHTDATEEHYRAVLWASVG